MVKKRHLDLLLPQKLNSPHHTGFLVVCPRRVRQRQSALLTCRTVFYNLVGLCIGSLLKCRQSLGLDPVTGGRIWFASYVDQLCPDYRSDSGWNLDL